MISFVGIWSLVFLCGVFGESPTYPSSEHAPHLSSPEEAVTFSTGFDQLQYTEAPNVGNGDEEWKPYSPDVFPLFKKAIQELASSERGILIFWDSLMRPEPPRAFFEQVFRAYNRMVDDVPSSSTIQEDEATTLNLGSTEPGVSELLSSVYNTEEPATVTEDSGAFYHASISSDGDEVDVYYTTENPEAEVVVVDESYYTSSVEPESQVSKDQNLRDMFRVSSTEAEDTSEADESDVAASESDVEDVLRRSGVLVEEHLPEEVDESGVPLRVGSIRGIPCENFPCYEEIPITSFSCADKRVPGIYADLETGCQVFHVCWPHRRESFLCPIGTTFNQPITACDYWYSSNCSLSPLYFEATPEPPVKSTTPGCKKITCAPQVTEPTSTESHTTEQPFLEEDWFRASKFVPIKTKVTVYFKPEEEHSKHPAHKKPVSKTVKQKHVIPLIEDFLELTKNIAKDAVKLVPKVVKPEVTKQKVVFKKPAAKLVPCLEIKDHHKPTPPVVIEPKPLPTLNPRFIVKPIEGKKPLVKVHYGKKNKFVSPKVHVKQFHPHSGHKTVAHPVKDHASEIVLKALEMAGDVFQRDILALTRQALTEDYKPKN